MLVHTVSCHIFFKLVNIVIESLLASRDNDNVTEKLIKVCRDYLLLYKNSLP